MSDPETAFGALLELLGETPEDTYGAWGVAADWPETISLVVRCRPGVVGETRRVAHVVPMRPGEWHGYTLTAWCGTALDVPELEFLAPGQGMPCVECVRRALTPAPARGGAGTTELPARREPGSYLAARLRRDSGAVTAGLITPAEPPWPSTDPDATDDPYADHLHDVLDGLHALGTPDAEQEGQHR